MKRNILLEAKSDEVAEWLKVNKNIKKLQLALNNMFVRAKKTYCTIVKFIPIHFDPPQENINKLLEANNLEKGKISMVC